jgi:hypothetical protein
VISISSFLGGLRGNPSPHRLAEFQKVAEVMHRRLPLEPREWRSASKGWRRNNTEFTPCSTTTYEQFADAEVICDATGCVVVAIGRATIVIHLWGLMVALYSSISLPDIHQTLQWRHTTADLTEVSH